MKKGLAYICLILLGTILVSVFWQQELAYARPTPVPSHRKEAGTIQDPQLALHKAKQSGPASVHFADGQP